MKALDKDRGRRYETVNDLILDVRRYFNREPGTAAAPTFSYRFRKFYLRNQFEVQSALTIALLLIISTVFSAWQAKNAKAAGRSARMAEERATIERDKAFEA